MKQPPPLYPIVNLRHEHEEFALHFARALLNCGVRFFQVRAKELPENTIASFVRNIQSFARTIALFDVSIIVNDSPKLCRELNVAGVHLGQDDMNPTHARAFLGPDYLIGYSTHSLEQVQEAQNQPVDYLGFGPIFSTTSKQNPDPLVGVQLLSKAVAVSQKPLVAIGGIKVSNVKTVYRAGCQSAAVIQDLEECYRIANLSESTILERIKEYQKLFESCAC